MRELFEEYIMNCLNNIEDDFIELTSGDIHRQLGDYPGKNHHMPVCCSVMRSLMKNGDAIIHSPLKGNGATLKIRYYKKINERL